MIKTTENPHVLSAKEVVNELDSNYYGLSNKEAQDRLKIYGPNELPESKSISLFLLLLKQFKNWMVIILVFATAISWLTGHIVDTWVIISVIFVNAGIGFSQGYRAEKAITSLKKIIVETAKVLRDGELFTIPSSQLVLGDVIVLEDGDSISADARIIQSKNLRTIEASLTGESLPVSKKNVKYPKETPMADRKNMVWKGTFVARGYAKAIVTGTGINTAIGSISETLSNIEETRTSFNKKTDVLAKQMSVIAITSAVLMFLIGYFYRHFEIEEILLTSIALLVAAIPEGLPAVISIVLAIGAHRMAKRNAIVREFTATETLGAITAILTDKTGTLTQNTLTTRKVFIPGETDYTVTGEGWFPVGNFMQEDAIIDAKKNSVCYY